MSTGTRARTPVRRTRSLLVIAPVVTLAALVGLVVHQSQATSWSFAPPSAVLSGIDEGAVPDGATVFDEDIPAVARLDPSLLDSMRRAAADGGIDIVVNSGWRSPQYQESLLDEAVSKYGSREEAARWVATPETSAHVSGEAIDIGPSAAATWLSRHGAAYGLCRIYQNEPWHFELRPNAADHGCPTMYTDPTHDPRMQQ